MAIAVLGTGLLGAGFVENLLAKGHAVRVWNRSADKLGPLVAKGAVAAADPAEAVRGAERVHLVLAEDDAVDAVLARAQLAPGAVVLDHSTNHPDRVAERYARLRAAGIRYLSAPVFMAPADARGATGLMLVAGPTAEVDALKDTLATMTGRVWHVGERPDLASAYKLLGNASLVSLAGIMGDLFAIGEGLAMTPEQVLALFDVFRPGSAMGAIGARVAKKGQGPASFELSMARKDVRLMIEAARGPDGLVVLPAVARAMDDALAEGHAATDFAVYAWPRGRRQA